MYFLAVLDDDALEVQKHGVRPQVKHGAYGHGRISQCRANVVLQCSRWGSVPGMTQRNKPRREVLECSTPGCTQPRFARKKCQEHYLAGPAVADTNSKEYRQILHHAKLLAAQLEYFDFVAERTGERIVFSLPQPVDVALFMAQTGWRYHPDLAVLKKTVDADGQPMWMPTDAPDIAQREFPMPDLEGRNLPVEHLDALEAAIKRARAAAADMGVDLNGVPDNAG